MSTPDPRAEKLAREIGDKVGQQPTYCVSDIHLSSCGCAGPVGLEEILLPFATRLIEAEERIAAFEEAERLWVADFDSEHPEIIPTPEEKAAAERMVGVVRELIEQKKVEEVIRERDSLRSRLHSLEEAAKKAVAALDGLSRTDWTHLYGESLFDQLTPERTKGKTGSDCTGYRVHLTKDAVKAQRLALSSLSSALKER